MFVNNYGAMHARRLLEVRKRRTRRRNLEGLRVFQPPSVYRSRRRRCFRGGLLFLMTTGD